jgi:serine/threonine-protein kinase TTK/MPS1
MDKKQIDGYANEISLLKRLRGNPSIIQMYDSELDLRRKSLFVVMELGEVDLNYVLHQRAQAKTSKSLDMNFIRLTWQQMLSAVHCIHLEKIIHSDLKPANFLFVRGALKLIDFGIAKAIANPEDTTKIIRESQIGTLNYMSPESIVDTGEGEGAGPRMKIGRASDVWSLGIILYEMLYGKTPFAKYHFIVKLQAIINEDHKISYPNAGDSAEGAIDAIQLCLRRNPEERPPIVGENGLLNEHWFLHSSRRPSK